MKIPDIHFIKNFSTQKCSSKALNKYNFLDKGPKRLPFEKISDSTVCGFFPTKLSLQGSVRASVHQPPPLHPGENYEYPLCFYVANYAICACSIHYRQESTV